MSANRDRDVPGSDFAERIARLSPEARAALERRLQERASQAAAADDSAPRRGGAGSAFVRPGASLAPRPTRPGQARVQRFSGPPDPGAPRRRGARARSGHDSGTPRSSTELVPLDRRQPGAGRGPESGNPAVGRGSDRVSRRRTERRRPCASPRKRPFVRSIWPGDPCCEPPCCVSASRSTFCWSPFITSSSMAGRPTSSTASSRCSTSPTWKGGRRRWRRWRSSTRILPSGSGSGSGAKCSRGSCPIGGDSSRADRPSWSCPSVVRVLRCRASGERPRRFRSRRDWLGRSGCSASRKGRLSS